jgi:outer membrane protein assembly factor BamB
MLSVAVVVFSNTITAHAGELARPRLMIADYNPKGGHRLLEISTDGKKTWEHKTPGLVVQFQILSNGHIVYGYGGKKSAGGAPAIPTGTQEIDRDGKVYWNYTSPCPESVCFERLANGNTLVAETDPCRVVTVSPEGKVLSKLPLATSNKQYHSQIRRIQQLPSGNILAAMSGEGVAREFRPDGSTAWEYGKHNWMFEAVRLPNGNTLVSCGTDNRVVEVDPQGKIVWDLKSKDIPEVGMIWTTSVEQLPNGHFLIGNFMNGRKEPGAHCFEITREKKVVWQYADSKMLNGLCQVTILKDR